MRGSMTKTLVIDVWEGSLEIDEAVLITNGVHGIGIRLNDMNGGHHMDTNFVCQWEQAKSMVRFPYFVYNPWVDGRANFNWLLANMPYGAKSVAIDVEVAYSQVTPAQYGQQLGIFLALANTKWKTIIYTAEWFLSKVTPWPKVDYWWAQYPSPLIYFKDVKTWDALYKSLDNPNIQRPFNAGMIPGALKMWQISGDYLVLPGTVRDLDVNIFFGSVSELAAYFGSTPVPQPEEPTLTDSEKLAKLWQIHPELH